MTVTRPCYLTELPAEILEEILSYLHPCLIAQCRILNRALKLIVESSIELQLRIELGIDGYIMEWPLPAVISAHEMLKVVQKRRLAFETGTPFTTWTLDAPQQSQYEISNGVLGYGILPSSSGYNGIRYENLYPTSKSKREDANHNKEPGKEIILGDGLTPRVADFSFSFDDNLQVLVSVLSPDETRTIYFRTIDTNEPHPQAASTQIVLKPRDGILRTRCLTLLSHSHISFALYASNAPVLHVIYNWRTGDYALPYQNVDDIAFLNEHFALLLLNSTDYIGLSVYNLDRKQVIRRLKLPFRSVLRSAYFITGPPKRARSPSSGKENPFESMTFDPKVEVIGLQLTATNEGPRGYHAYGVISIDGLLRKMRSPSDINLDIDQHDAYMRQSSAPTAEQGLEGVDIQWDEWGPPVMRWFDDGDIFDASFRSISGSRFLVRQRRKDKSGALSRRRNVVCILEFNLRSEVRSGYIHSRDNEATAYNEARTVGTKVVRAETVIKINEGGTGHAFNVLSSLPYRVIDLPSIPSEPYYDYYLDGNTVLGRDDTRYDIYSFCPSGVRQLEDNGD
ncbi:hypothetical protein PIIN_01950 [Serendipita indica DSM 11827]|uniref:F-box domain-containing protein n=1 Tax=Serendipita indica (strain DSM 11827) TaxID=1109443 RepID=G4T9S9_SERID|nr:hypothetical protein PIIN_01950 [Serendipita indica DSM 11827]